MIHTAKDTIQTLIEQKSYTKAVSALLNILSDTDEPVQVYEMLGKCFLLLGDFSNAIRSFEHALKCDPLSADTQVLLGIAYDRFYGTEQTVAAFTYDGLIPVPS